MMLSEEQSHLQVLEVMRSDGETTVKQNGAFAFPACGMCLGMDLSVPAPPHTSSRQGWLKITSLQEAEIHHEACSGIKVVGEDSWVFQEGKGRKAR